MQLHEGSGSGVCGKGLPDRMALSQAEYEVPVISVRQINSPLYLLAFDGCCRQDFPGYHR